MKLQLFAPGRQYSYPHFYGQDKDLLDDFWETNKLDFNSVAYDVPVLGFFDYEKRINDNINRNWEYLASLKIDMVGFTPDDTYIFEFKHVSKAEGLGQLLVYQHLCVKHNLFKKPYKLYFVSYQIRPVLIELFELYNINYINVIKDKANILF